MTGRTRIRAVEKATLQGLQHKYAVQLTALYLLLSAGRRLRRKRSGEVTVIVAALLAIFDCGLVLFLCSRPH